MRAIKQNLQDFFCQHVSAHSPLLVTRPSFHIFFTRNSLTSELLSRFGFLWNSAVEQQGCCCSTAANVLFLIDYRLLLIFLSSMNQFQTGLGVRHHETLQ